MKKIDIILAAIIGFLNGVFFFFILKQTGIEISYPWFLQIMLNNPWILIIIFPILAPIGLFIAFLIGKKLKILFQAAKFFLVGTLNTFIDIGIVELLTFITKIGAGMLVTFFKAISFLTATINSYFWNKYWTFQKGEKAKPKEFLKFLVVTAIGFTINVLTFHVFFNIIGQKFAISVGIWRIMSIIIAAFFAFLWNFLASKLIVFK